MKFWAALFITVQAVGAVGVFMELDMSRTSIKTTPRRLAVPVDATLILCTLKTFMKYVGALTLAVTLNQRTPLGLALASVAWLNDGVTVGVPSKLKYPVGKFAVKN